jgi:hypothetical protein
MNRDRVDLTKKGELGPPASSPLVVVQAFSLWSAREPLASRLSKRGEDRAMKKFTQQKMRCVARKSQSLLNAP